MIQFIKLTKVSLFLVILCSACAEPKPDEVAFVREFYTKLLDFNYREQGFENRPKIRLSAQLNNVIAENDALCKQYGEGPCGLGGVHDLYTNNFESDESRNSKNSNLNVSRAVDGTILVQFNEFPNEAKSSNIFDTKVKVKVITEKGNLVVDDFIFNEGLSLKAATERENGELKADNGGANEQI